MNYVSADHIAREAGAGRFEPQRTNNFTLLVAFPAGVGGAQAADVIALSLSQVNFPQMQTTPLEVPFGNEVRKVSGKWTFTNETLQVKDYVDAETSSIIDKWQRLVYDASTGRVGYADQYKSSADLLFFGPDGGLRTKPRRWLCRGLWPSRVKYGEGNMSASNHNQIEIEFTVDKIIYMGRV